MCRDVDESGHLNAERGSLTLHIPGPPNSVVEADLVSPKEFQTSEVLPFGRHQITTEKTRRYTVIKSHKTFCETNAMA